MAHRFSRSEKEKWVSDPTKPARRPPVQIPESNNRALIEEHKLTLIGRVTNPGIQKTRALVDFFLQHWRVTGTITGKDLGPNLFQFKFQSEQDLQFILSGAPYHFKRWMIILQRWEPVVSDFFPALIPFWITVHGIPLHYWTEVTLKAIRKELGPRDGIEELDVDRGRIRVLINGLKPLEMKLDISLPSGEIKQVELHYENLQKHCFRCKALSHEEGDCPENRARANIRSSRGDEMGISQARTLERLEADRRKKESKRALRRSPSYQATSRNVQTSRWDRVAPHNNNENQEKSSGFDYGIRRDPSRRISPSIQTRQDHRQSARERLSFSKDSSSMAHRGLRARGHNSSPLSEWRPVGGGSTGGISAIAANSVVSRTPPPNPLREPMVLSHSGSLEARQISANGGALSKDRVSALERIAPPEKTPVQERLSLPTERIPLLLDGMANSASGRLQPAEDDFLDDTLTIHKSGGSNIDSGSKHPSSTVKNLGLIDGSLDRSPIRTLSEDRIHVSLRLGPLYDPTSLEHTRAQMEDQIPPLRGQASVVASASSKPPVATKKRGTRSPTQGVLVKRRRVTKTQNSPKRRTSSTQRQTGGAATSTSTKSSDPAHPRVSVYPSSRRRGTDFRSAPNALP